MEAQGMLGSSVSSTEQESVIVQKGSRVLIMNPNWDNDDPKTQFNVWIVLDEDAIMHTASSSATLSGTVVAISDELALT